MFHKGHVAAHRGAADALCCSAGSAGAAAAPLGSVQNSFVSGALHWTQTECWEISSPLANSAVIEVGSGSLCDGAAVEEAVGRWAMLWEEAVTECCIPDQK